MEDVVERAVELIERVGLAYLFGGGAATDLPNLHTELTGRVSIGDWDDETGEVWLLRGRLPELSVAWYGEWLRRRGTFVASRLLPAALRWTGTPGDEQGGVDRARAISTEAASLFEALLVEGPLSSVEMRRATDLTGAERTPTFSRALRALRRGMLITTFGVATVGSGWDSAIYELTARAFTERPLEDEAAARTELIAAYLAVSPGATPASATRLFENVRR
ncbi:MAG TPA: hypothetical protein VHM94_16305 [Acidimicrobiia bacterium]|jgi:hypothetical protein|nr:hypothetical protein [Acidimicrobiia bacterium]